jgi:hypothetical protein
LRCWSKSRVRLTRPRRLMAGCWPNRCIASEG